MSWAENLEGLMMPPKTPTLDRVSSLRHESGIIGEFLEWLQMQHSEDEVADLNINPLLHEYFDIDPQQEERERSEVLAYQRLLNEWVAIRKELGL